MSLERSPFAMRLRMRVASLVGNAIASISELTESDRRRPGAGGGTERRPLRDLTFGAYDARDASELSRKCLVPLDEDVEGEGDLTDHTLIASVRREPYREVSLARRTDRVPERMQPLVDMLEVGVVSARPGVDVGSRDERAFPPVGERQSLPWFAAPLGPTT